MGSCSALRTLKFAALWVVCAGAAAPALSEVCRPDLIEVKSASGQARFRVEVADTDTTRAVGLMNRPSMPKGSGMIFVYDRPAQAQFWMKNTLIPLDMIFADAQGRVRHVHAKAIPHDETVINGGPDILVVLEINGGLAAQMGITEGSLLRHPAFSQTNPLWPCN